MTIVHDPDDGEFCAANGYFRVTTELLLHGSEMPGFVTFLYDTGHEDLAAQVEEELAAIAVANRTRSTTP